jgi:hypothetical protein
MNSNQDYWIRWILIISFLLIFLLACLGTLGSIFLDFGNLNPQDKDILLNALIIGAGSAIIGLFYSVFGLKNKLYENLRVRLNLIQDQNDNQEADVLQLLRGTADLEVFNSEAKVIQTFNKLRIQNDQGPYILLPKLKHNAETVYIAVSVNDKKYTGSFTIKSYLIDLY